MSTGIVTVSCLGQDGRFGNQMFQYAFARAYADKLGAELQTPKWVGQEVFEDIIDNPITVSLPTSRLHDVLRCDNNVNLWGYFQSKPFTDFYTEPWVKNLFRVKPKWRDKFYTEKCYAAAHVRRGDFTHPKTMERFCVVTRESYQAAYDQVCCGSLPLQWISDETPTIDPTVPAAIDFLPDFMTLINAKVLFRANSSFSFWAGVLTTGAVYSPIVDDLVGVQTVPFGAGNWHKIVGYKIGRFDTSTDIHLRN